MQWPESAAPLLATALHFSSRCFTVENPLKCLLSETLDCCLVNGEFEKMRKEVQ